MTPRARRLAEATRSPILDRRAAVGATTALDVGDARVPRAGAARIVIDDRVIELTHLDRILWPETAFTKAELIAYYLAIADVLLPHLRERPLTLGRFPGGVDGRGFAQTEVPGRPAWLRTVPLVLVNGATKRFTLVEDRAGLAWLAQMGTIELHAFLSVLPDLERPTAVVFDLDPPPEGGILAAARVACRLRDRLLAMGLMPVVKTSGSAGLHVLVAIAGEATYAETRAFAARIAAELAAEAPELVTDQMARARRGARVLIDVRQNARRLTTVVPYSLRATDRPTASVPVTWEQVDAALAADDPSALVFEASEVIARVASVGDPLAGAVTRARPLPR